MLVCQEQRDMRVTRVIREKWVLLVQLDLLVLLDQLDHQGHVAFEGLTEL